MWVLALAVSCLSLGLGLGEVISLSEGQEVPVQTPNYPEHSDPFFNREWSFSVPSGRSIKLVCHHFNTYRWSEDCKDDGMHIDMGKKESRCGNLNPFDVISISNTMKIRIEVGKWRMAQVNCVVKSIPKVHIKEEVPNQTFEKRVHLKFNDNAYLLRNPEYPNANTFDNPRWIFTADPGHFIGIVCNDVRMPGGQECFNYGYGVKLEFEGNEKVLCAPDSFMVGAGQQLTVTIQRNRPGTSGSVSCRVNSLKTDKAIEYYHAVESNEEDSSEHGVVPGRKGTTCKCGWSNRQSQRVIGGAAAKPNEFSFMVSLRHKGSHTCGGSIVTNTYVLTAAHCTAKKDAEDFSVAAGAHNYLSGYHSPWMQVIDVIEKFEYPRDPQREKAHDVALVRLKSPIEFNDVVGPICMPHNLPKNMNNQKITIMGWGIVDMEETTSESELQKGKAHIVDPATCYSIMASDLDIQQPHKLCYFGSNSSSTCMGDSGSPLVWVDPETNRYTQLALVSHHIVRCVSLNPPVGAYVPYYMDWIKEHVDGPVCVKND